MSTNLPLCSNSFTLSCLLHYVVRKFEFYQNWKRLKIWHLCERLKLFWHLCAVTFLFQVSLESFFFVFFYSIFMLQIHPLKLYFSYPSLSIRSLKNNNFGIWILINIFSLLITKAKAFVDKFWFWEHGDRLKDFWVINQALTTINATSFPVNVCFLLCFPEYPVFLSS